MKQLLYTRSRFYKPLLTNLDFSFVKIRKYLVYAIDNIAAFIKDAFIRKFPFFVLLFIFFSITSFGQRKISGVVITPAGSPLSGATISVKGTKMATATNADGSFVITAKLKDVLLVSYVGYDTRQIIIGNETNLRIFLAPALTDLDQVVVTGYTSQKIKEIAGSVAVVNPKDLTAVPGGQVEQMLQGRVAGLTIITSGMPGGGSNIRLHGIGNFGDVTPLYIIDGTQGDINNLNPADIESLQVLKDAGAYAIYGVRGANGVIVITTKKGKGETKITYDFYVGKQFPSVQGYNQLAPQQEADLQWQRYRNSGWVDPSTGNPTDLIYGSGAGPVLPDYLVDVGSGIKARYMSNDPAVDSSLNNIDFRAGPIYQILKTNKAGTDWFHALFKPAFSQNHSITVSGSNERNKYLFSLGYLDQQGTLIYTYLKRYTARVNTEFDIKNAIRLGENIQLCFRDNPKIANQAPLDNDNYIQEILQPSLSLLPITDIKGNWWNPFGNPVAQRNLYKNDKQTSWDIFGNAFAEANFLKNFTARTSFGGTLTNYFYHFSFYPSYEPAAGIYDANSSWIGSGYVRSWTWTNTLNYSRIFSRNHSVKALIGTEAISNSNREVSGQSNGFFIFDPGYISVLQNGSNSRSSNSFAGRSTLYSMISRFEYGFGDKYFFTGTLRRDGSSVFSAQTRYGWFPSLDAAYRISNENFFRKLGCLTDLKIRTSWGITGYDGNTDPTNQFYLFGGGFGDAYYDIGGTSTSATRGFRNTVLGNPKTKWQQDIVSNLGLDLILWNGKLSLTTDLYKKESSGLLFPIDLPATVGGGDRPNVNIGDVQNTGVDLLLSSKGNFSKDWRGDLTATFSTYKNKILKLNGSNFFFDPGPLNGTNYWVKNEVGHPIGSFYGFKVIGLWNSQTEIDIADAAAKGALNNTQAIYQQDEGVGRFRYLDANGDLVIDANDRVFIGNPNPSLQIGQEIHDHYRVLYSLSNLGRLFQEVEDYPAAIDYYSNQPRDYARKNKIQWFGFEDKVAEVYFSMHQYDSALYFLQKYFIGSGDSAALKKALSDPNTIDFNVGRIFLIRKEYDKALRNFLGELRNAEAKKNPNEQMETLSYIVQAYIAKGQFENALLYSRKLLTIAQHSGSRVNKRDATEFLWKIYDHQKSLDSAYKYYRQYAAMKDSVTSYRFLTQLTSFKQSAVNEKKELQYQQRLQQASFTKKALLIGIIAILFISVFVFRFISLKRKNEANQKEILRNELVLQKLESEKSKVELQRQATDLEMQALRAQMNPHFIFNSLNSINRFILQNNRAQASEYLTKFSKLVRMILQNSQASLITLESELESLRLYLEMEALRFNYHFDYKISVPGELDIEVLKVPPLFLQPYVENSIWHGLMHKEEKGQLDIEVSQEENYLFFKITDNGIGRQQAAVLESKSTTKHKSMGLRITADRIAIMQNSTGTASPVTINDLVNADGTAAGTEVIIKMPLIEI